MYLFSSEAVGKGASVRATSRKRWEEAVMETFLMCDPIWWRCGVDGSLDTLSLPLPEQLEEGTRSIGVVRYRFRRCWELSWKKKQNKAVADSGCSKFNTPWASEAKPCDDLVSTCGQTHTNLGMVHQCWNVLLMGDEHLHYLVAWHWCEGGRRSAFQARGERAAQCDVLARQTVF